MTNYRPTSLLTIFVKYTRKLCTVDFLHTNNILVTKQYGFRKGVSTDNPALRLTDSVFKSTNQKLNFEGFL